METFVAHIGEVPPDARRLADFEARQHRAPWLRRVLGKGICSYVIGYTLADRWWTYCFERSIPSALHASEDALPPEREFWSVEAYDSSGRSWTEIYRYDSLDGQWQDDGESVPAPGKHVAARRVP